ncbi:hypothetical protein LTR16_003488 [Cryomyces antarcticus]|uniref:Uncharacterized protein n=1 Tax=Cryomyces antarcticus TaxID=329879 RepID=A0ABR0LY49_9PEZI|nr:hypothetical protein LTR16_003488 [Cryomyces antarcticus]
MPDSQGVRRSLRLSQTEPGFELNIFSRQWLWSIPFFESWIVSGVVLPHLKEWKRECIDDASHFNQIVEIIDTRRSSTFSDTVVSQCRLEDAKRTGSFESSSTDRTTRTTSELWTRTIWLIVKSNKGAGTALLDKYKTSPQECYEIFVSFLLSVFREYNDFMDRDHVGYYARLIGESLRLGPVEINKQTEFSFEHNTEAEDDSEEEYGIHRTTTCDTRNSANRALLNPVGHCPRLFSNLPRVFRQQKLSRKIIDDTDSFDGGLPLPKKLKVGKYLRRNSGSRESSRERPDIRQDTHSSLIKMESVEDASAVNHRMIQLPEPIPSMAKDSNIDQGPSTRKGIQSSTSHMIRPDNLNACETIDPSQPTAVNIEQPVTQLEMTAADKDEKEFATLEHYKKLEKELATVRVELGRLTTRNAELDSAALLLRALAKEVVVQTAGMTGSNFGVVGEVLGRLRDAVQD